MFHNIVHFIVLRPASVTQSAKKKTSSEINAAGNHEPGRGHCQPGPNSARAGPGPQCANAAACKPDSHGLQARARMGAHSLNGPGRPDCGIPKQSKSRISTHEIIIIIDNLLAPFLLEIIYSASRRHIIAPNHRQLNLNTHHRITTSCQRTKRPRNSY